MNLCVWILACDLFRFIIIFARHIAYNTVYTFSYKYRYATSQMLQSSLHVGRGWSYWKCLNTSSHRNYGIYNKYMCLFVSRFLLNILHSPLKDYTKTHKWTLINIFKKNYILAQATRMNKKTFNMQITNHLQMQI